MDTQNIEKAVFLLQRYCDENSPCNAIKCKIAYVDNQFALFDANEQSPPVWLGSEYKDAKEQIYQFFRNVLASYNGKSVQKGGDRRG